MDRMDDGGMDLRGWKAIAAHLQVREDTARTYANRHGMPVYSFMGRIEASSSELQRWRQEMTVRRADPARRKRTTWRDRLAESQRK